MSNFSDDEHSKDMSWLKFFPAVKKSEDKDVRKAIESTEAKRKEIDEISTKFKSLFKRSNNDGA